MLDDREKQIMTLSLITTLEAILERSKQYKSVKHLRQDIRDIIEYTESEHKAKTGRN